VTARIRPTHMRPALGTLLATAALGATAGCGSTHSDVELGPGGPPTPPSSGPVQGAHVSLVSVTGAGGRVSRAASLLDTAAHLRAFERQFRPGSTHRISSAVARAKASGHAVFGAVIAVGCDRPPGADVVVDGSGRVQILPHEVASPLEECLVAVTTVAIADVPGSD
jgi:hypothetical protein